MRVMIVDNDEAMRLLLCAYIDTEEGLEVVAEASSGREAIELALLHTPDVVLLDVQMPDGNGVDACREIRDSLPDTRVIMLTAFDDNKPLFDSIMAGAAGYLIKGGKRADLIRTIRAVGEGGALLDPMVTQRVLDRIRSTKPLDHEQLDTTEEQVLDLVAKGLTDGQIAEQINLSVGVVKRNVASIRIKLERRLSAVSYMRLL